MKGYRNECKNATFKEKKTAKQDTIHVFYVYTYKLTHTQMV